MHETGKPYGKILLAVSGGSDSLALLHMADQLFPKTEFAVATVDHGLRKEAADEAAHVAQHAAQLNYPHRTLKWAPTDKVSSSDARNARYELLIKEARRVGANAIALGHTMEDQAETIMMRARRTTADSDTRGLSGISAISSYDEIALLRPLLNHRRHQLRDWLTHRHHRWVDDPSNSNPASERVRTRSLLSAGEHLPAVEDLARFATLGQCHRKWLAGHAAELIANHTTRTAQGIRFEPAPETPVILIAETLTLLIWTVGGQAYRVPKSKLTAIATALSNGKTTRFAIGKCLISIKRGSALLQPEQRLPAAARLPVKADCISCGGAMKRFRPDCDDSVHAAICALLDAPVKHDTNLIKGN